MNQQIEGLEVWYGCDKGVERFYDQSFGRDIKWDLPLLNGYNYKIFRNYGLGYNRYWNFWSLFNPGMMTRIWNLPKNSQIVIHGWGFLSFWIAMISARISGRKVFVKGDSNVISESKISGVKKFIKRVTLGILFKRVVDGALYIGEQNRKFYKLYGMSDDCLHFAPMAVDNDRFQSKGEPQRNKYLNLCGWEENSIVFFYTGKLSSVKNVSEIIQAFTQLNDRRAKLVIVGDGPLRDDLEEEIEIGNNQDRIKIIGFVNQLEIVSIYHSFDVFIMTSKLEAWGLSINEAMAAGRPLILAEEIGGAIDLVKEGINGFTYKQGNIHELVEKMKTILSMSQKELDKMGDASKQIIDHYSYDNHISAVKRLLIGG